jgi:hypothetical protein
MHSHIDIVSARPTVRLSALGFRAPIDQYPADNDIGVYPDRFGSYTAIPILLLVLWLGMGMV